MIFVIIKNVLNYSQTHNSKSTINLTSKSNINVYKNTRPSGTTLNFYKIILLSYRNKIYNRNRAYIRNMKTYRNTSR